VPGQAFCLLHDIAQGTKSNTNYAAALIAVLLCFQAAVVNCLPDSVNGKLNEPGRLTRFFGTHDRRGIEPSNLSRDLHGQTRSIELRNASNS